MPRYALVIGIAKYDNLTNLPKAVNDAEKIAHLLRERGRFDVQPLPGKLIESENRWQVTLDKKLTGKELGQTLRTFLLEKAKGSEALIYLPDMALKHSASQVNRKAFWQLRIVIR